MPLSTGAIARRRLQMQGAAAIKLEHGERLFITAMPLYGIVEKSLVVAYEKGGVLVYAGDRPLNKFQLVEKGFPFGICEEVADLMNDIAASAVSDEPKPITEGETHE
jgi:hypothetical protein